MLALDQFMVALSTCILEADKPVGTIGVTIVTLTPLEVAVHPLTSVIVKVYVPEVLAL